MNKVDKRSVDTSHAASLPTHPRGYGACHRLDMALELQSMEVCTTAQLLEGRGHVVIGQAVCKGVDSQGASNTKQGEDFGQVISGGRPCRDLQQKEGSSGLPPINEHAECDCKNIISSRLSF